MQDFNQVFDNHVLWVALVACLVAQTLKLVFEFAQTPLYQSKGASRNWRHA